ncbi:MAG: hypothetical protein NTY77_02465 [Elusimicrobia bacterium]|nr:hypothetical protein [Elusimicrobiota bacterium]
MIKPPLSARLDQLLKRYQDKVSQVQLDLPLVPQAPAPRRQEPLHFEAARSPSLLGTDDARPVPQAPLTRSPAPAPGPVWSRGRWAWLAGLLLAAAAAIVWLWRGHPSLDEAPAYRAFPITGSALHGLAWRDGRLASVDSANGNLVLFDAEARRLRSTERLADPAPAGLAWVDKSFWSTGQEHNAIFRQKAGPERGRQRIYATPNRSPAALAGDDDNLWAADARVPVVYRYLVGLSLIGASLSPLNQYDLPGAPAAGLHAADGLLWVLDSHSRRLTRYAYEAGTLSAKDSVDLSARIPAAAVSGLEVGGGFLWVLTTKPAVLHRFSLRGLSWQSAGP